MRKSLRVFTILLVIILLNFAFTYKVFADEEILGEAISIDDNNEELNSPTADDFVEAVNEELELKKLSDDDDSVFASDVTTISSASDFTYENLSDGTITITGLKSEPSGTFNIVIPDTINGKKVTQIDDYAFYNVYVRELTLSSNIHTIGIYSFGYCWYLNKANLSNVKIIKEYAFRDTGITGELSLTNIEEIRDWAFYKSGNRSVSMGKNLKVFYNTAFVDTPVAEYKIDSANSNFTSIDGIIYSKDQKTLVAYPRAKLSETYTMPNTVTTIRDNAVYGNPYLITVKLSDNLDTIPQYAFATDKNLTNITIGSKIKSLGKSAFAATGLKNVTIPANVESIDGTSFLECKSLESINVDGNNKNYSSINGVLFSKDKKTLITYPSGKADANYNIPSGTVVLGESSLQYAKFKSVNIPSSVTTFKDWCFAYSELTNVTVPSTVTTIGYGSFDHCLQLVTATDNSPCNVRYLMFANCSNLTTVKLTGNIKVIENRAFYNDPLLSSVTYPSNLNEIWVAAFMYCPKITKVSIPASVTYLQAGAYDSTVSIDISKTKLTKLESDDYCVVTDIYISGTFDYQKSYECLNILNKARKAAGLSEFKMDKTLLDASMQRAGELAIYFDHDRPNGTSCYTAAKNMSGENIAAGNSTAQGTYNQWYNSAGHKANMFNSGFTSIGIGCFKSSDGMYFWVQNFGRTAASVPSSIPANSTKEVKIQAIAKYMNLYWSDNKTNSSVTVNDNITKNIKCKNSGWSYVSTTILNKSFNWSSSNSGIATVDGNGKITGKKVGSSTITANLKNLNKSLSLNLQVEGNLPFKDVKKSDWYYDAVKYVYSNGIISGYNATTYAPNEPLTRGMIVTILYRMDGMPNNDGKSGFSDVPTNEWYSKAVKWAVSKGVVHGYGGTNKFGPNDNIIRQDLAGILKNYAKYKKKNTSESIGLYRFTDYWKVDDYALSSMQWAVSKGVITGNGDGSLNPKGNTTRAEAAAMFTKYCNNVGR